MLLNAARTSARCQSAKRIEFWGQHYEVNIAVMVVVDTFGPSPSTTLSKTKMLPNCCCNNGAFKKLIPTLKHIMAKYFASVHPTVSDLHPSSTHWEESLQSVSDYIFNKYCGCTPRGVRGVKGPKIL